MLQSQTSFDELELLRSFPAWRHTVEFSEVDAAGVVNYASFFSYVDEAFLSWWGDLPHPEPLRAQNLKVLTANAEFSWLAPLHWQDPIAVFFGVGPIRRSSFEIFAVLVLGPGEIPRFLGRLVQVYEHGGRPADLPQVIRLPLAARQLPEDHWKKLCALLRREVTAGYFPNR